MHAATRIAATFCAALLAASLLAPPTPAHRRPWHHRHRPPRAVLVVGEPRPAREAVVIRGVAHGTLDLNVKPRATEVWVNGELRGTCDAFDGYPDKLHLPPGAHRLRLVTPGGESVFRDINVRAGTETNIGLDLR